MRSPFLLLLSSFFISPGIAAQISLKAPRVCHDKDGYLRCYSNGSYLLKFAKGNFETLSSADSGLQYSDKDKTLIFYSVYPAGKPRDTIKIKLQLHSILVTNGKLQKEITSLPSTPSFLDDFHISTYTENNRGAGLGFWAGHDRYVQIKVWDWKTGWSWNIVAREAKQTFLVNYNAFRKNRIESIMLIDDSLKYGMSVSMTFKTLEKLWWLRALYVDTATLNGRTVVKNIPLDNAYWYRYKRNGKIDKKKTAGEIKLCDCGSVSMALLGLNTQSFVNRSSFITFIRQR